MTHEVYNKVIIKNPPHPQGVATLPCKILMADN